MFQKCIYANAHLTQFIIYELILSKFSTRDLKSSIFVQTQKYCRSFLYKGGHSDHGYPHHAAIGPYVSKPHKC